MGITNRVKFGEYETTLEWIRDENINRHKPFAQVYGICFNKKDEILIIREPGCGGWSIPGGTPEGGETYLEALQRELLEEADVTVKKIWPLGVQKVTFPNNPNKKQGEVFYQYRCVCEIGEVLPQTMAPDKGFVFERKFVPADEITKWVKWGKVGEALFADAISLYRKLKA